MSDMKKARAKEVFDLLCKCLDNRDWNYERVDDDLVVYFNVSGDDLPVKYIFLVDDDRQLIRLLSPMSFDMVEDKRIDGAIAACHASYGLVHGNFDYDVAKGNIAFRMVHSYFEDEVTEEIIYYMIDLAGVIVDKYNDKFFALNKGYMSIEKFLEI